MFVTTKLKAHIIELGASLVGVTELTHFKGGKLECFPPGLLDTYTHALSIAVALDYGIMQDIDDTPTVAYADHYRQVNIQLDALAEGAVKQLQKEHGRRALAIPASKFEDPDKLFGAISHKAVARMAGLGWQGKSLLIINSMFGPSIRLVTVLTDMPLYADRPMNNRCGKCDKCQTACPVGAIKGVGTDSNYSSREEAIDLELCNNRTLANNELPDIGARVCGVCVKACPWGSSSGLPEKRQS